jgi:hypothetical protein
MGPPGPCHKAPARLHAGLTAPPPGRRPGPAKGVRNEDQVYESADHHEGSHRRVRQHAESQQAIILAWFTKYTVKQADG